MRRRRFTVLSILSLMLCFVVTGLWIGRYFHYYGISVVDDSEARGNDHWREWFMSRGTAGLIDFFYDSGMSPLETFDTPGIHRLWRSETEPPFFIHDVWTWDRSSGWSVAGFGFARGEGDGYRVAVVPLWPAAAVFSLSPLIWLLARIRRKRREGYCDVCGYDVRASPDRCPECGTAIMTKATT